MFEVTIPGLGSDSVKLELPRGGTVVLVGANGAGKTRLAVWLERKLGGRAHRVAAHRALSLDTRIPKTRGDLARQALRIGYENENAILTTHRSSQRWKSRESTHLLNDYPALLKVLFADQSEVSLKTHTRLRAGDTSSPPYTMLEKLKAIWERVIPHRKLIVSGDDIQAKCANDTYSGGELSDGERSVFYLTGQVLAAESGTLLIVDEPELHLHPAILKSLWDELQAARTDCSFVFITHNLDFAASRHGERYAIREYHHPEKWSLERVLDEDGFDEALVTLILGSRKPILFVEGDSNSLDLPVYRCCFPEWTVVPRMSCSVVIHSVATMKKSKQFTRILCHGIVDADGRTEEEIQSLRSAGVSVLAVAELENLLLLPAVTEEIFGLDSHPAAEIPSKQNFLRRKLFERHGTDSHVGKAVMRQCRRQVDASLKRIDLSAAAEVHQLESVCQDALEAIMVGEIADSTRSSIETAISDEDLSSFLKHMDDKGMLATGASVLRNCKRDAFERWVRRELMTKPQGRLSRALKSVLPDLPGPPS